MSNSEQLRKNIKQHKTKNTKSKKLINDECTIKQLKNAGFTSKEIKDEIRATGRECSFVIELIDFIYDRI